jgi:hypothetical protein
MPLEAFLGLLVYFIATDKVLKIKGMMYAQLKNAVPKIPTATNVFAGNSSFDKSE